jgi:hypothetical protein
MLKTDTPAGLGEKLAAQALVWYESLTDLVEDGNRDSDLPWNRRSSYRDENGRGWTMTESLAEATRLALTGWAEGTGRIASLSERLTESVSRHLPHYGMDLAEEGGEVDVAAYLNGDRQCMWDWRDEANRKPVVRVTVNIAASANVAAEDYVAMGALAAATVDALENTGRRVELDVYQTVRAYSGKRNTITTGCRLKDADRPLDLGALAYAVVHPSMLRRTLFSVEERSPAAWRDEYGFHRGGGYGIPADLPEELRGDLHLDLREAKGMGAEAGYDWVLDRLREQGVEVVSR